MKPHQIVRQIKFLFYTIAVVLLIFSAIALYYVTAHGKAYEVGLSYESNLRALLLILALAGIPASFIFHSQKVKHIDKALGAGIKLQQYRTSYFIKIITLEGLSLLSLLAFITTAQLNYLSIFGILYLALVISFPRKLTILDELEIDPSDVTTHTTLLDMVIAVDFDGTIVEHRYPAIGQEKLFAFETLKALQQKGHLLILWTFRSGKELTEAVDYCRKNGLEFYAINKSFPEEVYDDSISRKVNADLFIDDRNVGGFIGWGEIWQMINSDASGKEKAAYAARYEKAERRTFCGFMKYLFCKD